ncbi:MAG: hypothetical protein ACK46O_01005 [Flavobacteriia bacterium]|jgi:hypothetical protein
MHEYEQNRYSQMKLHYADMTLSKYILSLFLLIVSIDIVGQTIANDYIFWGEGTEKSPSLIILSNSQIKSEIDNSVYSVNGKRYLFESRYLLAKGNEVLVNLYNDSTILYREYSNGKSLHQGELKLDYKRPYLFEKHDELTGETVGIDTTYFLSPTGLWILNENTENYEKGIFETGIKVGDWEIIDKKKFHLPVILKRYTDGILSDSLDVDFSENENIQSLVVKNWIRRGVVVDREDDCIYILYVTNDSNQIHFGLNLDALYNEIHLSSDFSYTALDLQRCGTGPSAENNQKPKGYWNLTKGRKDQNYLNLENDQFLIEYLTDKEMILKIKKVYNRG